MHYPLRFGHLFDSATKRKTVDIVFVFAFSIIIVYIIHYKQMIDARLEAL